MPATGRERVAAGVLVGAATLFVGFAIPRAAVVGFFGALTLPLVLLAADLVIAAAVVTWWYPIRPAAQGLAVFGILVHALVMLRGGPVWTRGCSGVLLLLQSWALLQLFLMTASEDDYDEPDGHASDGHASDGGEAEQDGRRDFDPPPGVAPGEAVELVETPVTEVVEVAVAAEPEVIDELPEEAPVAGERPSGETADEPPPDTAHEPARDNADDAGGPGHEHEERIR